MAKKRTLACRDLGMDCKFKVTAKNDQKIEAKIAKHLKKNHALGVIRGGSCQETSAPDRNRYGHDRSSG